MRDRRTDRLKAPDVTDEAPATAARTLPNAAVAALVQRLARTGRGPGGARAPAVAHDVSNQALAASMQRLLAVDGNELGEMDPGLASSTQQQAESAAPPVPPLDTAAGPSEATDAASSTATTTSAASTGPTTTSSTGSTTTTAPPMPGTSTADPTVTPPTRHQVQVGDGPTPEIGELQQRLTAVGNRVSVTGMFDAATATAVTAFQTAHPPLPATGVADLATWARLDALAPTLDRNRFHIVEVPGGANQAGSPLGTITHPTVRLNDTGPAVLELQQRLRQTALVTAPPAVTGTFDAATRTAVIEFQRAAPSVGADGVVGPRTWAKVDALCHGPIDQGAERTTQRERVEGSEYIIEGRYAWRIDDAAKELRVTVNIQFTENPTHASVALWVNDMRRDWNTFLIADRADPTRRYNLVFDPVPGGSPPDASVAVDTTPDPAPPAPPNRSNAGRFYTSDTSRNMASHEFGHLIGLPDEYNNPEEQYFANTGEQVHVGDVSNTFDQTQADGTVVTQNRATPESIAHDMGTVLRSAPAATRPQRLDAIRSANGLQQGGFSRRVANAYRAEFGGQMKKMRWVGSPGHYRRIAPIDATADIADDIAARLPGTTNEQVWCTSVFLNTNNSLMGDMTTINATTGAKVDPHDHPVLPRHVRHFGALLAANRPGDWELRYQ